LYAWPFLEARFTGDRDPHHLLDLARYHPVRTALGAATLCFYVVLFLAASNDLLAIWLDVPVERVTVAYQIALLVLPPVVGYLTYRLMRALAQSAAERLSEMPASALRPH
jgi:ubiquinol-cytochrome c reductase cytochrome b subunit